MTLGSMRPHSAARIAGLAAALTLTACGPPRSLRHGEIEIDEPFAFAPITQEAAAVYFHLRNNGPFPDTLLGASTSLAQSAMLHGAMGADSGSGMAAVGPVPLPPKGELTLRPGGTHLMLMNLARLPRVGEHFTLELHFARSGTARFEVPVRPYAQ